MALLGDEDTGAFQSLRRGSRVLGARIKGGGGIRKIRVAVGSRGSVQAPRVIYYWAVREYLTPWLRIRKTSQPI